MFCPGLYYGVSICLVSFASGLSVVTLNVYHRGVRGTGVSPFLKTVILRQLARFVFLRFESDTWRRPGLGGGGGSGSGGGPTGGRGQGDRGPADRQRRPPPPTHLNVSNILQVSLSFDRPILGDCYMCVALAWLCFRILTERFLPLCSTFRHRAEQGAIHNLA